MFPQQYASAGQTELTADVVDGPNEIDFDLG